MLALALAATAQLSHPLPAQTPPAATSGFLSHALRHARVEVVHPRVVEMLAGGAEPLEVQADVVGNKLLVRGSPQGQALVAQLLAALDQPSAAPTAAAQTAAAQSAEPPVVRSYAVPAAQAESLARELQAQYTGGGIRIAADPRTAQLLVVAPEAVQQQIAARTNGMAPQVATPNVAQPTANSTPGRERILQRLEWNVLEAQLRSIYGNRLSPTLQADGRLRLRLTIDADAPLDLAFEPTTRRLELTGPEHKVAAGARLIAAWDGDGQGTPKIVPYRRDGEEALRRALAVSHRMSPSAAHGGTANATGADASQATIPTPANLFQPRHQPIDAVAAPAEVLVAQAPAAQVPGAQAQAAPNPAVAAPNAPAAVAAGGGLVGPVQIEFLDGLDVLVISGNERDVERVMRIIDDIERLSVDTQPVIEVINLTHVGSDVLAEVVAEIYDSVLLNRQGTVSITALVKPNALLLVGRGDSVQAVRELVAKLDQPVEPASQFAVYTLKHASAATVSATLTTFFTDRTALGGRVQVTVDARSNAVIVRGGPRDLAEAAELIRRIDVAETSAENELRIFPLKNAPSDELAPIIQDAVNAQGAGAPTPGQGGGGGGGGAAAAARAAAEAASSARSTSLRFTTIDAQGHRQLKSGILTEVRVTSDPRANALIVSAPHESMELVAALIRQLDEVPAAEAQIKVFTIVNGDAASLVEMMQTLFGQRAGGGQGAAFGPQQQQFGQNPIVRLQFSVDQRTNSIIVSGTADDLNIVEAILLRLDESDVRQRQSVVYRLKNAPALDVANAINQFLRSEREVQQTNPALLSPFEQIEKEVVVVPEPVSNSLIVSATPRYFEEIRRLVVEIDARPPMVLIQVLIAEVALNNVDEFGVELGLQDSILFDRSLLGDLVTITNSTQQAVPGGGTITTQNQRIVAASNQPGFVFNNAPLGNSGSNQAIENAGKVAGQGLTNFAVGRTNAELGYGGLVLSASSESVSVLLRALQETRRLDVLSRPQVMTLDNQAAFVQVGSRVPRVTGVTIATTGQTNNVVDVNVGLILGVTPRISPDGLVVMEIDAEKSALGSEADGVPISVSATGDVVRQPVINTTTAQTTVSAMSGQTVVLGGLITKGKSVIHRRVPMLSSLPILGQLFRYDNVTAERTELLIIMTPHVVRSDADVTRTRQIESARMSWVLGDVKKLHGNVGLENRFDDWADCETSVVYPDGNVEEMLPPPTVEQMQAVPMQPSLAPPSLEPAPPAPAPLPDGAAQGNQLRIRAAAPTVSAGAAPPADATSYYAPPAQYASPEPAIMPVSYATAALPGSMYVPSPQSAPPQTLPPGTRPPETLSNQTLSNQTLPPSANAMFSAPPIYNGPVAAEAVTSPPPIYGTSPQGGTR